MSLRDLTPIEGCLFDYGARMNGKLTRHAFTAGNLPSVQSFHCGDETFEKEVADWLAKWL